MTNKTKLFAKGGIAAAAVGAMALASATPAQARDRAHGGISVGDVIAGAVIIGGIAAVASAVKRDRYDDRDYRYREQDYRDDDYRDHRDYREGRYYRGDRWGYRGSPRAAVERCVNAARREARRDGYRHAQVTDIRGVQDTRYGYRVTGRIVVDTGYYGGRYDRYGYYGRDNRYNRWNDRDSGRFTCDVSRGQVVDVDIRGIRERW